jgi:hypothetical protein
MDRQKLDGFPFETSGLLSLAGDAVEPGMSRTPVQGESARPVRRLLVVVSHVVQHSPPILQKLAQDPRLEILVAYCSMQDAESGMDPGFGVEVTWDQPQLDGYPWVRIPNRSPRPGLGRF